MKRYMLALGLIMTLMGATTACASEATGTTQEAQSGTKQEASSPVRHIDAKYMREYIFDYKANPNKFVFKGQRPAILDFYADWCGPCRQLSPRLAELAKKYEGKVDVYKINVDNEEELARIFGVRSIPMLLFIPMEGTPSVHTGALSSEQLETAIAQILKK